MKKNRVQTVGNVKQLLRIQFTWRDPQICVVVSDADETKAMCGGSVRWSETHTSPLPPT